MVHLCLQELPLRLHHEGVHHGHLHVGAYHDPCRDEDHYFSTPLNYLQQLKLEQPQCILHRCMRYLGAPGGGRPPRPLMGGPPRPLPPCSWPPLRNFISMNCSWQMSSIMSCEKGTPLINMSQGDRKSRIFTQMRLQVSHNKWPKKQDLHSSHETKYQSTQKLRHLQDIQSV